MTNVKDLNMHYAFAPIYDFEPTADGAPRRQYGVGVLSKYPILQTTNHSITRLSTQDPNPVPSLSPGFLEVLLNIKGTFFMNNSSPLSSVMWQPLPSTFRGMEIPM